MTFHFCMHVIIHLINLSIAVNDIVRSFLSRHAICELTNHAICTFIHLFQHLSGRLLVQSPYNAHKISTKCRTINQVTCNATRYWIKSVLDRPISYWIRSNRQKSESSLLYQCAAQFANCALQPATCSVQFVAFDRYGQFWWYTIHDTEGKISWHDTQYDIVAVSRGGTIHLFADSIQFSKKSTDPIPIQFSNGLRYKYISSR